MMRRREVRLAIILVLVVSGCVDWRVQWVTPEKVLELESPTRMRVVMWSNLVVQLNGPHRVADSLVGTRDHGRWAAPFDSIAYVSLPRSDGGASVAAFSLVLAIATVVAGTIAVSQACLSGLGC